MRVVLDASAAVELLLKTRAGRRARQALSGEIVAAPAHLDAEVLSALVRLVRGGTIEEALVPPALRALARAPIERVPIAPLLAGAWSLRANVSSRDALYVVLARRLDAALVTADARLSRAPGLEIGLVLVRSGGAAE